MASNGLASSIFASIKSDYKNEVKVINKVTIVGVGQVGMACAYAILAQSLASEIALVDVIADKLQGEGMDLLHATAFARRCTIRASTDHEISRGSRVVVLTAGVRQREGESRLALVQRNVDIFNTFVPKLAALSPDACFVVVANPVDIMAYVTWRLSGLPLERVFGTGTMLDSGRFRVLLAEKLGIAASSVHSYIIGEHGDSSVPVWSGVTVGGVRLVDVNPKVGQPDDPEHFAELHKSVVNSAYEIIKLKGYTSWGIGLAVCSLVKSILHNEHNILPLSTQIKSCDFFGGAVNDLDYGDVFLSLPCVVCSGGVKEVVRLKLSEEELGKLRSSAKTIHEVVQGLKWPANVK